ncbi:hypothetical protein LPJ66_004869 [Kickxella alabastrina]|uniref:Uncharacterized protein n=1 Tax=Kickxella alabastrina TaxID=61397 RepID=A0ACC1IIG5_9FUNG|nr:hypothetical protein LPJ66_004869 [Kickxella alabastrina]
MRFSPTLAPDEHNAEKVAIAVGPWVRDTEEHFIHAKLDEIKWVFVASHMIPTDKKNEYCRHCTEHNKYHSNWGMLKEFLMTTYSCAVSYYDMLHKYYHLQQPGTLETLEEFVVQFKYPTEILEFKLSDKHVTMTFLMKLPPMLNQQILSESTSLTVYEIDALTSCARAFLHIHGHCDNTAMNTDAIMVNAMQTERRRSGLPPFASISKQSGCTKEMFEKWATDDVCLGCGSDEHKWHCCPKKTHPKARRA